MGAGVGRESDEEAGTERSVEASGSNSIAAGGDIANAITGGVYHEPVIMARTIGGTVSTGAQVAGDHVDFRDATINGRVVAAEHHHYGSVPAPAEWRPVADAEPLEFGVRPTQHIPGQSDVPPYVPRDRDEELRAKLAYRGLVLILGEPYAGKSYTAWHGVRSLAGHRLYAPDPGEDLRGLLAVLKGAPGEYVVWLDEVTDHLGLGEGGLDPRLLGRLTALGAVVLGTMDSEEYYRRRSGSAPGDQVVAMARTVELPREWSEAELVRLATHDDPRAYPAYMWSGKEGAASYFAVGHLLFDEWRRVGTRAGHPRGHLLVRAAVDLARCSVTGAVPVGLLRQVQERYGTEDRESFDDALAWATTSMFGVSGLLVRGEADDTWRAYGALVAEALRSEDLEPVPDEVWWLLLDAAEGGEARIDRAAVLDAAHAALHPRFEEGDAELMFAFADRVGGEARETLLRAAADAGHPQAAEEWAALLLHTGDEAAALRYLESAAERGSVSAAGEAGRLHRIRAERFLRTAAEGGDGAAAHGLGDMLLGTEGSEALRWYVRAVGAGHERAAAGLGRALEYRGSSEAEFWIRRGAALGDPHAVLSLAVFLHREGDHDAEVEQLYRRAMAAGHPAASRGLGNFLVRTGSVVEGMELLRHSAVQGDAEAAFWLWRMQSGAEREEAEEWLRRAAEQGHYYARKQLGELPVPPGDRSVPPGDRPVPDGDRSVPPGDRPDTVTE
ncbi:tetratricopeptide repeat protein [Streptomyces adelaidensis]|uniref:tetratricopeptide repeat protein n=1 Tax=Streptomyces adelaidensis TaxID=2796465 RepID=UPI001906E995|nr:tetratricopeptide repeat protein [Streptomyces adelaidensis]